MSEEEFKEIVMPLREPMYGYAAYILGDRNDSLDAMQDALANLWEKRHLLERSDNRKAYCIAAVRNSALMILRRKDRDSLTIEFRDELEHAVRINHDAREDLQVVRLGIEELTESQRKILLLRSVSGLSHDEISNATGIKSVNVRKILSRARESLKKYIENYEKKH